MISLRALGLAGLALLGLASIALPARATVRGPVSAAPLAARASLGHHFATSVTGVITGENHGVMRAMSLDAGRSGKDKTVQPAATVTGGLPLALGSGDIPDIIRIDPAPGGPLSSRPTITVTFGGSLPAHAYLVIMLSGPGGEAALKDAVVHGKAATVTVDPLWPLKPGSYTLHVAATTDSGEVFYQGTYTVPVTPSAGTTPSAAIWLPATCKLPHAVPVDGDFPKLVGICPAPGSRISAGMTFTVIFAAALPRYTRVTITLVDTATVSVAQLIDQLVKGNTVTVKVAPSPRLPPGTYQLVVMAGTATGTGGVYYQVTYTVR